jgi:hypothetical protein
VTLALTASAAVAQQGHVPFWSAPGTTLRDTKGNIIYTEIKDPKAFTMRVLDRGQWLTYRYEPNSTKVTRVETPDTTDDYLYDGDQWNGTTVHARGRAHTIRVADGHVSADNMAPVTVERDARGRDTAVKRGTDIVATITYDSNGQVRRLTVGAMVLDFAVQSDGVHETLQANGAVLYTGVAHPEGKHYFPMTVSLDPVVERLGLRPDWRNSVNVHRSATGSLLSISDAQARPVVEMVQFDAMSAAFDAKGAPLFYDLSLKYTASTPDLGGGDAGSDVTTALNGVLPNRIIVPLTGDASAYVQFPGDGAISSIWTADAAANPYRFRVYHEAHKATATLRTPHATSSSMQSVSETVPRNGRRITPLLMWQCGSYEYWSCDSSGGSGYCGNYYEPQYCDTGGGGGGYTPPPDDSGGSSGGSGTGNQVSGDPDLRMKVNASLSSANTKLQSTRCGQDLFKETKLTNGTTTLADVLAQRGSDSATWLNALKFVNGYANGSCASFPAWTFVNDTTVNVCSSFKALGASAGAVILIHEELHSLGLTEKPQYPDALMTSDEITQWVMKYCGG